MSQGQDRLQFELVLPCYNESPSLPRLIEGAARAAGTSGFTPETFQLVVVQNGSTDDSAERLKGMAGTEWGSWFRVVSITQNEGYGAGLWAGLKSTTARYVGWSHADEQCDLQDAFRALELLRSQRDKKILVKGYRSGRRFGEMAVSRTYELLALTLVGLSCREINAQPKIFPRELLLEIAHPPKMIAFDLYVLYHAKKAGYRFLTVPVRFPPRAHGKSSWAATKLGRYKTFLSMALYLNTLRREEGRLR